MKPPLLRFILIGFLWFIQLPSVFIVCAEPPTIELQKQIEKYEQLCESNPRDVGMWHDLADLYRTAERWDDAIHADTQAVERFTNFAIAYYGRGKAFFAKKEYEKAKQNLSKTIELRERRGGFKIYLELEQPPDDYIDAYRTRGVASANLKEYPQAIHDLSSAIQLNKTSPKLYFERAYIYELAGSTEKAVEDYIYAGRLFIDYKDISRAEECIKKLENLNAEQAAGTLKQIIKSKQPKDEMDDFEPQDAPKNSAT